MRPMDIDGLEFGHLRDDEWEQVFDLRSAAFAGPVESDETRPRLGVDNVLVARRGSEVLGTAASADFAQNISGGVLAMGGVTGVAVAPHAAGQGIAKTLMRQLLEMIRERNQPIACLYPSTSRLYRSVGFESAGIWAQHAVPISEVHKRPGEGVSIEVAGPEIYDTLRHLHEEQARSTNGWAVRDEWWWAYLKHDAETTKVHQRIFVASTSEGPCAAAVVRHTKDSGSPTASYDFDIADLFGRPEGFRAIVAALATQGTMAGRVLTVLPYPELDAITDRPETSRRTNQMPWMERIIDVEAALTGRPVGHFSGALHLAIRDDILSANAGNYVLEIDPTSDRLLVTPGGNGTVAMDIATLAPLYTGYRTASQLAASGRITGATAADLDCLDRCFSTSQPTLIDFF